MWAAEVQVTYPHFGAKDWAFNITDLIADVIRNKRRDRFHHNAKVNPALPRCKPGRPKASHKYVNKPIIFDDDFSHDPIPPKARAPISLKQSMKSAMVKHSVDRQQSVHLSHPSKRRRVTWFFFIDAQLPSEPTLLLNCRYLSHLFVSFSSFILWIQCVG